MFISNSHGGSILCLSVNITHSNRCPHRRRGDGDKQWKNCLQYTGFIRKPDINAALRNSNEWNADEQSICFRNNFTTNAGFRVYRQPPRTFSSSRDERKPLTHTAPSRRNSSFWFGRRCRSKDKPLKASGGFGMKPLSSSAIAEWHWFNFAASVRTLESATAVRCGNVMYCECV